MSPKSRWCFSLKRACEGSAQNTKNLSEKARKERVELLVLCSMSEKYYVSTYFEL